MPEHGDREKRERNRKQTRRYTVHRLLTSGDEICRFTLSESIRKADQLPAFRVNYQQCKHRHENEMKQTKKAMHW